MIAYVVVDPSTLRLLGQWWTPVCEVAQAEANRRGGIAVSASFMKGKTGIDPTRMLRSFGHDVDNNRPPKASYISTVREEIRAYEDSRLATSRVA